MSPAKTAANIANAIRSTGPRTEEGKARSARNALKHGLTSKDLIVRDDEKEIFEQFQQDLRDQLTPQGPVEMFTFNQLVRAGWNMQRAQRLETDLFVNGLDPLLDEPAAKTLDRIHRHAAQAERSYYRHLKELRTLQTTRVLREVKMTEQDQQVSPILVSYNDVTKRSHAEVQAEAFRMASDMLEYESKTRMANAVRRRVQNEPTAARQEGNAA